MHQPQWTGLEERVPDLGSLPGGRDGLCKVTDAVRTAAPPRGAGTLTSHLLRSARVKLGDAGVQSLGTQGSTRIQGGRNGKCHAETHGEGHQENGVVLMKPEWRAWLAVWSDGPDPPSPSAPKLDLAPYWRSCPASELELSRLVAFELRSQLSHLLLGQGSRCTRDPAPSASG